MRTGVHTTQGPERFWKLRVNKTMAHMKILKSAQGLRLNAVFPWGLTKK